MAMEYISFSTSNTLDGEKINELTVTEGEAWEIGHLLLAKVAVGKLKNTINRASKNVILFFIVLIPVACNR